MCHESKSLDINLDLVKDASESLVRILNEKLEDAVDLCSKLQLDHIKSANVSFIEMSQMFD